MSECVGVCACPGLCASCVFTCEPVGVSLCVLVCLCLALFEDCFYQSISVTMHMVCGPDHLCEHLSIHIVCTSAWLCTYRQHTLACACTVCLCTGARCLETV